MKKQEEINFLPAFSYPVFEDCLLGWFENQVWKNGRCETNLGSMPEK